MLGNLNDEEKLPGADARLLRDGSFCVYNNAGETINGLTLPVPCFQLEADSEWYGCDANDLTKLDFGGFAISNGTNGNPIQIQTSGVVSGFSSLTSGRYYYVQDDGTIGLNKGTYEILVGRAVSTTQIKIIIKQQNFFDRARDLENGLKLLDLTNKFYPGSANTIWTVVGSNSPSYNWDAIAMSASGGSSADYCYIYSENPGYNIKTDGYSEFIGELTVSAAGGSSTTYVLAGFLALAGGSRYIDSANETRIHIAFIIAEPTSGTSTIYGSVANGTTQTKTAAYSIPRATKVHLRLQSFGSVVNFYVNGALIGSITTNIPATSTTDFMAILTSKDAGNSAMHTIKYNQQCRWIVQSA